MLGGGSERSNAPRQPSLYINRGSLQGHINPAVVPAFTGNAKATF